MAVSKRFLAALAMFGVLAAAGAGAAAPDNVASKPEAKSAGGGQAAAMALGGMDKVLAKAGATDDQKQRMRTIVFGAIGQIAPLAAQMKGMSERFKAILTAPTIDRAALEQFRASLIADIDQASRVLFRTIADAADVLRPDQRAKLAASVDGRHDAIKP